MMSPNTANLDKETNKARCFNERLKANSTLVKFHDIRSFSLDLWKVGPSVIMV